MISSNNILNSRLIKRSCCGATMAIIIATITAILWPLLQNLQAAERYTVQWSLLIRRSPWMDRNLNHLITLSLPLRTLNNGGYIPLFLLVLLRKFLTRSSSHHNNSSSSKLFRCRLLYTWLFQMEPRCSCQPIDFMILRSNSSKILIVRYFKRLLLV